MFNFVRFSKKTLFPLVAFSILVQPLTLLPDAQAPEVISTEFRLSRFC